MSKCKMFLILTSQHVGGRKRGVLHVARKNDMNVRLFALYLNLPVCNRVGVHASKHIDILI